MGRGEGREGLAKGRGCIAKGRETNIKALDLEMGGGGALTDNHLTRMSLLFLCVN